jgi:hypothetical protein
MRFAFALLLLGCASPVPLRPPPPGKDLYYTLPAPAQSRFLHLAADGVFHLYVRSLPMTTEALRGTWRVDGETQAVLRCERWSHMTVVPPVRVRFGTDWAAQVPHVRTSIADFLREHPERGDFSREELEDVGNWETRVGGEAALVIPIGIDVPRVSRRELEAVLPALDAYRESGDPREVRVRLHRHRGTGRDPEGRLGPPQSRRVPPRARRRRLPLQPLARRRVNAAKGSGCFAAGRSRAAGASGRSGS